MLELARGHGCATGTQALYKARPGAAKSALPPGYQRREPEKTLLHEVVRGHLSTFLEDSAERGGLPSFVTKAFLRYLECGVLAHGFTRVACSS